MHARALRLAAVPLAVALAPVSAGAQMVVGHVIEADTRAPISQAEITLDIGSDTRRIAAVTDSSGWFVIRAPAPGRVVLDVTHIAYAAFATEPFELARGVTIELEIRLGRTVIPLDPLVVTARSTDNRLREYHERLERNAFGSFITREEIDSHPSARVTDLFRSLAGVRVVPVQRGTRNMLLMRNGCSPSIFLDGARIDQSADFPIDDLLVPEFLEGVEVYTSFASAPAQYIGFNSCGVILFWSRSFREGKPFSWKRLAIGVATAGLLFLITR